MEKRGPTAGSGNYGQACMQCFKAKCRCIQRPDGGACERCHRLKKPCQPSNSVRRRTTQNGQSGAGSAEIAKLEDRINTLTTMLQSVMEKTGLAADKPSTEAQGSSLPANARTAGAMEGTIPATSGNSDIASMAFCAGGNNNDNGPFPTPFHTPLATRPPPPPSSQGGSSHLPSSPQSEPPLYDLSLDEAAWYLDRFCIGMLPHFPFVSLAPDTTVAQLCHDRPLLMQAIIAVATPSNKLKIERAERLKQTLTRCAVIEDQSNIDVLLGILTYVTWSTDPFQQPANNLSRMTMLAISLVYDLQRSSRDPPPRDAHYIALMTPGFEQAGGRSLGSPGDNLPLVLEKQRAFLACFVLSSIVSTSFGRMVALRWTTQMEEGLQLIEATAAKEDCPSDANLAVQVRLQIFIQRAALVREQLEADRALSPTTATATPMSTNLYMKVLQGQLKELRNSFSPNLPRRDMLLIYTHYADLCLNEVTRLTSSEAPLVPTPATSGHPGLGGTSSDPSALPSMEHIECLWRSVYAIKAWFDAYQAIPPLTYVGVPFFFWFQLVRCVVLLKHLSTFSDPNWDCQAVRNAVDMSAMLEWMAVKAELASKEAGEESDDDLFRRVGNMMRNSLSWLLVKQRAATGVPQDGGQPSHTTQAAQTVQPTQNPAQHDQQGTGNDTAHPPGGNVAAVTDTPEDGVMMPVDPYWTATFGLTDENWVEEMLGWPMATI